jgi:hypothetical protein
MFIGIIGEFMKIIVNAKATIILACLVVPTK